MSVRVRLVAVAIFVCGLTAAGAQAPEAQPAPPSPAIPAPVDKPYPGVIRITVDATDLDRRILAVTETLPAKPGPLTLLYPRWLPGNHSPTGAIDKLAGLTISAGGRPVPWVRDPVEVAAFHVDVPAGVETLDVAFQFLSPTATNQGQVVVANDLMNLEWNHTVLYPAGYFARGITVAAAVRLPRDWTFGTALETESSADGVTRFKPVSLDTLVDSPMFAGRYGKRIDLDPNGRVPVNLNVFADRPELIETTPAQIEAHRSLVQQAYRLFGSRHFDHYDFLLALSDHISPIGLEHHRSSQNGPGTKYFTDWDKSPAGRDLLAHEFTHSWNGKFRRPADLWTPNFNVPMRDSLLWVYEGQTQYWGYVLAARSGLLKRQQALDAIAGIAAGYDARAGRAWKNLQDTTNDPIVATRRPQPWVSWQRSEDYYNEGLLVWLDADTLIRELSKGARSLDDFARAFFGIEDGRWTPVTYTFDDVVAALTKVQPYDWAGFLRKRLDDHAPGAPLDGLGRGGYRLTFTDKPTDYARSAEMRGKITDLSYSLGITLRQDGDLSAVLWNSPAFAAGLATGMKLIAVNGIAYDVERLKEAIKRGGTIEMLVRSGDVYKTVKVDASQGLRFPHLERVAGAPARLDDILAPRKDASARESRK